MTTENAPPPDLAKRAPKGPARAARILYYYSHTHLDTGSPRALVSVVEGLNREQFTPVFLALGEGPLPDELRARGAEIVPGMPNSVSPRRPWESFAAISQKLKLLRSLDIDLVHLHETGWNLDLIMAAAIRRIPIVLHLHNPVTVYRKNLHWIFAHQAVFVSHAHLESAIHIERIQAKSRVIYNAVALERFASGTSLRETLGVRPDQFVVGTVSQLSQRKGIDVLVDAAARLIPKHPEMIFLIAGPGPPLGSQDFANAMRAREHESIFQGRLRFVGGRSDVPDFLATCDAFVLPTRSEPLGIAIIEAMAAGLPVIASRVGGIPEIINSPEHGFLLDRPNVDTVTRAIENVFQMPDRGRAIGRAGAASLWGRFDGASIAVQWNELYSGALRAHGRIPR